MVSWPASRGQSRAVSVWACLCSTGKWPTQLLGSRGLVETPDCFAQCAAQDIDPAHALCDCPATEALFNDANRTTALLPRSDAGSLLRVLLSSIDGTDWHMKLNHIQYVSYALGIVAGVTGDVGDSDAAPHSADEAEVVHDEDIDELLAQHGFQA